MEARVGARPAGPAGPAPDSRSQSRVARPGHAARVESQDPPGAGRAAGFGCPRAPGGGRWPAGEDPELLAAGSVLGRPPELTGLPALRRRAGARCVERCQAP